MRLLDLFCGAGGAAMGYHQAGFTDIVGVDIKPQPSYPFTFIQGDALEPPVRLDDFDLIHASPPCQPYTAMTNRHGTDKPKLISEVEHLVDSRPHVIENVIGSGLDGVRLCGSSFDLPIRRHRLFKTSFLVWGLECRHAGPGVAVYGKPDGRRLYDRKDGTQLQAWASVKEGQMALGIVWTDDWHSIKEAIPPAYTKYIGEQFLAQ